MDRNIHRHAFLPVAVFLLVAVSPWSEPVKATEPLKTGEISKSSQPEPPVVSDADVLAALRSAKLVDPTYKLSATVSGDEILVTTERKPKSSDNECKIQAVLIGKTAFEAVKSGPQRVKVLFADYGKGDFSAVTVRRAEVKLFGQGQLSEKDLLASLELDAAQPASLPPGSSNTKVVPGPLQANRVMARERIDRLKERGTSVGPFLTLFDQVEQAANTGAEELVKQRLDELNDRLREQERVANNIQDTENAMRTGQDRPWESPYNRLQSQGFGGNNFKKNRLPKVHSNFRKLQQSSQAASGGGNLLPTLRNP